MGCWESQTQDWVQKFNSLTAHLDATVPKSWRGDLKKRLEIHGVRVDAIGRKFPVVVTPPGLPHQGSAFPSWTPMGVSVGQNHLFIRSGFKSSEKHKKERFCPGAVAAWRSVYSGLNDLQISHGSQFSRLLLFRHIAHTLIITLNLMLMFRVKDHVIKLFLFPHFSKGDKHCCASQNSWNLFWWTSGFVLLTHPWESRKERHSPDVGAQGAWPPQEIFCQLHQLWPHKFQASSSGPLSNFWAL